MTVLEKEPVQQALAGTRTAGRSRRRRRGVVTSVLVVVCAVLAVLALMLGDFRLSAGEVLSVLAGGGDGAAVFVVRELRLPRTVLGVLVGVAFGLAGGLFQSVLRNPLASPDVIGISQGASVGAVAMLLGVGVTGPLVALSALGGGALVGLVLYAVAWRGGLAGYRFVLSGIGVAYMASSVLGYLLTRSRVDDAQAAIQWLAGSLGQATWQLNAVLAVSIAALLPLVVVLAPRLTVLLLGDDTAAALGVRTEWVRFGVIALGVALAAAGTAAAGPVAFVALTAAPIARRLLGDGSLGLVPSALAGVALVTGADAVAQHLLPADLSVPVGIVTGVIGGPYLIWLLATHGRSREASA